MLVSPTRLIALNKPYGVLCQFRRDGRRQTLADYIDVDAVYPAGRLDLDSEGLVLLTNDGALQARISAPRHKLPKVYWVQIEREPARATLAHWRSGVHIQGEPTLPAQVERVDTPRWLWPRDPPIRFRKQVPTFWLRVVLVQGRNRQVRRMTAALGHPCLRLIRSAIGPITLMDLAPGQWRDINPKRMRIEEVSR